IFQKENTDKALKYGIYRHLPTYEKIIRNLVSFFLKKSSGLMYLGLDVALATWYNKKQHGFIPKERTIYYETESWRTAFLGYDRVGK
ncbi:MAG: hypothetical protein KH179_12095, partial [Blautia sp.]|nr:hypothetical protein [Blautia sp.]